MWELYCVKCPNCQTKNPEESTLCIQCGARVIEDMLPICPSCETELPAGARFYKA